MDSGLKEVSSHMDKSVEAIRNEFATVRTGKAAPALLDLIKVDAYGCTPFSGRIESIAAATGSRFSLLPPENASGNFVKVVQRVPVRIGITASPEVLRQLRPGLSVVPTIYTR